jgi:hypothetical protein
MTAILNGGSTPTTQAGDSFGFSLALNGDGTTLAIGAPAESGASAGIGGDQTSNATSNSGAIYLY